MKISSIICAVTLGAVFGCKELGISNEYNSVGSFSTRVEGQNRALVNILENYNSMPTGKDYKVKYTNENAPSSEHKQNALWYNKHDETLKLELYPPDGPACTWEKVTKDVLEQATKSSNGMLKVDSIANPKQATKECLR